jgi:hypothetical protein
MNGLSIVAVIILLAGAFLIGFGIRASQTFSDKVVSGVTGHYTRSTLWSIIGGAILILLGGILLFVWGQTPAAYS